MDLDDYLRTNGTTIKLKSGIDLSDLQDPNFGVEFEVTDETSDEQLSNLSCFSPDDIYKNLYCGGDDDDVGEEDDSDDCCMHFEKLAQKMKDISGDGGIRKKIVRVGSGDVVPNGAIVRVHYNGYLEYADEPFDSSRLRNEIMKFRLGDGKVIEGWEIAIKTMKKGEFSKVLIQPQYAYREHGCPPRIPPNSSVLFEIELLSFVDHAGVDDFYLMTENERREVTFDQIQVVVSAEKQEGTYSFKSNNFQRAYSKYKQASSLLEDYAPKTSNMDQERQKMLLKLYLNMSLCCLKLCHAARAIMYCKKALEIDHDNVKALYRRGQALHQLSDFDEARKYLLKAQKQKPHNTCINEELKKLERHVQNFHLIEKGMYQRMFPQSKDVKKSSTSNEAKLKADESRERSREKALQCTPEFKQLVQEKLRDFKNDPDLIEIPMPSVNLTVAEIACILETADDLQLVTKQRGSGEGLQIRIQKKTAEIATSAY